MEILNQFTANENKGLLWNLMCDKGIFTDIPDSKSQLVKEAFDVTVDTISRLTSSSQDTLINLNKRVISEMIRQKSNYVTPPRAEMSLNYSAAEISQTRQKKFDDELTYKKQEFDKFNNAPVPEKIDFSDNLDTPFGSELDKMLADQIAMREKQLNMVLQTQDKNAANEWIQNPNITPNESDKSKSNKLKIGEPIHIEISDTKPKKVQFVDITPPPLPQPQHLNKSENNDFLSLLKKKDEVETNNTTELLHKILQNQKKIIEMLENNKQN